MLSKLKIKIFADGADYDQIINFNDNPLIQGMTTNPSLMKKAGISNYQEFCKKFVRRLKINLCHLRFSQTILKRWFDNQKLLIVGVKMFL